MFTSTFSAKRPRLESSNRKEYDIQSAAMNEWLDKTEINLELLTTDPPNPEEKLTLEEQMVLIKVIEPVPLLFPITIKEISKIRKIKNIIINFYVHVFFPYSRTQRVM